MNSLELRKQLLVAESELNRAQLMEEWETVAEGVHALAGRAKTIGKTAAAASLLMAGFMAFRRGVSASAGGKRSWWQRLFTGAKVAVSLWTELSRRPKL